VVKHKYLPLEWINNEAVPHKLTKEIKQESMQKKNYYTCMMGIVFRLYKYQIKAKKYQIFFLFKT
jgi:hypothetical protein